MRSLRDIPITKGSDGLFHAKVTVGHKPNGVLDRRHRSGKTVKEVQAKLRDLFGKLDSGTLGKAGRPPTTQEWFEHWLTEIAPFGRRALAPTTLASYRSYCRTWIYPHLGKLRLDSLETDSLTALYAAMRAAGRRDATLLQVHAIIRRGLGVAVQRGKTHRNVARMVDSPGTARPKRTPLSMEAAQAIVEEALRRRNAARWLVGVAIGPRQGETLGLCWPQVDLDAGTVEICWQLQRLTWRHGCSDPHRCGASRHRFTACRPARKGARKGSCPVHVGVRGCPAPCPTDCVDHARHCPEKVGGGLVLRRPKTWREDNPVPHVVGLPPELVEALREHRAAQREERKTAANVWRRFPHPDGGIADFVFRQPDGAPIDMRQDYAEFQSILAAAGVDRARVHAMRHTAATIMLDLGIELEVVQEFLGHAQIATTRGYATVRTAATVRAAAKIGKALFGAGVTDLVTERQRRKSS